MLAGVSYEKVWEDQTSAFGSHEEVLSLSPLQWTLYLNYLGFECGFINPAGDLLRHVVGIMPRGIPYFCGVGLEESHSQSGPENTHAIVIDADGTIFDPLMDRPGVSHLGHYLTSPKTILTMTSVQDRRLID
jgi:hypothetical protein